MTIDSRRGLLGPNGLTMLAALGGLIGVAMGALGAHALRASLGAEAMALFHTAVQYQLWHCVAVLAIAQMWRSTPGARLLGWSCAAMLAGVLLFSGSLFALSITGLRWLGAITPIGGFCFMAGWAMVIIDRLTVIRDEV